MSHSAGVPAEQRAARGDRGDDGDAGIGRLRGCRAPGERVDRHRHRERSRRRGRFRALRARALPPGFPWRCRTRVPTRSLAKSTERICVWPRPLPCSVMTVPPLRGREARRAAARRHRADRRRRRVVVLGRCRVELAAAAGGGTTAPSGSSIGLAPSIGGRIAAVALWEEPSCTTTWVWQTSFEGPFPAYTPVVGRGAHCAACV